MLLFKTIEVKDLNLGKVFHALSELDLQILFRRLKTPQETSNILELTITSQYCPKYYKKSHKKNEQSEQKRKQKRKKSKTPTKKKRKLKSKSHKKADPKTQAKKAVEFYIDYLFKNVYNFSKSPELNLSSRTYNSRKKGKEKPLQLRYTSIPPQSSVEQPRPLNYTKELLENQYSEKQAVKKVKKAVNKDEKLKNKRQENQSNNNENQQLRKMLQEAQKQLKQKDKEIQSLKVEKQRLKENVEIARQKIINSLLNGKLNDLVLDQIEMDNNSFELKEKRNSINDLQDKIQKYQDTKNSISYNNNNKKKRDHLLKFQRQNDDFPLKKVNQPRLELSPQTDNQMYSNNINNISYLSMEEKSDKLQQLQNKINDMVSSFDNKH